MLKKLKIKNFAIIDDMEVEFDKGFSVIIGETGTGKSIIIEAINLILGARASASMIRSGCEKSFLQAEFNVTKEVEKYLDSIDIDYDEVIELTRVLNVNGKSSYKINGSVVNLATISKIRDLIIEIKRQSDNEISSDEYFAIKLIDKYANMEDISVYNEYSKQYENYLEISKKISEIKNSTFNIDVEYVKLQINRINTLNTFENEYEELIEKSSKTNNAFKINELGESIKEDFDKLYNLNVALRNNYEEYKRLGGNDNGDYTDISLQIEDFVNNFTHSSETYTKLEVEEIEERIYSIKKMFDLYGGDYTSLMEALNQLEEQLYQYENSEHLLLKYEQELDAIIEDLTIICSEINSLRKERAVEMEAIVAKLLNDMYMEDAKIKFEFVKETFNKFGNCNLKLLISTNNNDLLPITEIASGGEKARVILALKKVIVDNADISTIIFDEIDTGVSGRVAKAMGKVMDDISKKTQIIAITHLPQVAAVCPNCYVVEKSKENEKVVSNITFVDGEAKVGAIAKILSGDIVTDEAMSNARSLIMEG